MKNIYINSQGGLGFNLALASILKEIHENYDKICVLSPYFDVFESSPYVDAVYKPHEIRDFIFDAKNDDARLICERMYDSEDFIYKKVSYADAWRKAANIKVKDNKNGSDTISELTPLKKFPQLASQIEQVLNDIKSNGFDNFIICQFTGGQTPLVETPIEEREINGQKVLVPAWEKVPYNYENEPLKRHYPIEKVSEFVHLFAGKHPKTAILFYQLPNEPIPTDCENVLRFTIPYLAYYELAKKNNCLGTLSIDSSLQHLVAGVTKSVVLWGHSLPNSFSYEYNIHIIQPCRRDDILYFSALGPSGAKIDYIAPTELLAIIDNELYNINSKITHYSKKENIYSAK